MSENSISISKETLIKSFVHIAPSDFFGQADGKYAIKMYKQYYDVIYSVFPYFFLQNSEVWYASNEDDELLIVT